MSKSVSNTEHYYNYTKEAYDRYVDSLGDVYTEKSRHVEKVSVSAIAATKMLIHAFEGVETGMKTSITGQPIEVMGFLIGCIDLENSRNLIISDAFPLPVEGAETKVVASDEEILNYMINLTNQLEKTRKDKIMGWYHSHPFDLDKDSHCFLSGTDISTQNLYQQAYDGHGNPQVAIVIDPLRSLHLQVPVLEAFRVLQKGEENQSHLQAPDGLFHDKEMTITKRWGQFYKRYYTFPVEYYQSDLSRELLQNLVNKQTWISPLTSNIMDFNQVHVRFAPIIANAAKAISNKSVTGIKREIISKSTQNSTDITVIMKDVHKLQSCCEEAEMKSRIRYDLFYNNEVNQ